MTTIPDPPAPPRAAPARGRWQRFAGGCVSAFRAYANWLVGISWWRFFLLSALLLIASGILTAVPPFNWRLHEEVVLVPHVPTKAERARMQEGVHILSRSGYEISVDEKGVRIGPRASAPAASAASGVGGAASAPDEARASKQLPSVNIKLPPGADSDDVRTAVEDAREAIAEAVSEANDAAREIARETATGHRVVAVTLGDYLPQTALLFILASAIVKINYKGRLAAEVKAAQATETAESESLKRQVTEARLAAMRSQVEPHFLFNTLASIDHLIEVDPARASAMQKNLIALLRASMPTMREANAQGVADLGRELAVVRPYLEILKMRMEERLQTEIDVPDGLLSAEFPPMMIQSLVENAVKHGLEPKPEGGRLSVRAEIVHGLLAVSVADTGLGFGRAPTAGTGVGLANIRERLQLIYGRRGSVSVAENAPSGTRVTITVPYRTHLAAEAAGGSGA